MTFVLLDAVRVGLLTLCGVVFAAIGWSAFTAEDAVWIPLAVVFGLSFGGISALAGAAIVTLIRLIPGLPVYSKPFIVALGAVIGLALYVFAFLGTRPTPVPGVVVVGLAILIGFGVWVLDRPEVRRERPVDGTNERRDTSE